MKGNKRASLFWNSSEGSGLYGSRAAGRAEEKGFQVNLWGNAPDLFSVEVIAPSGEKIPRFVARKLDRQRYDFVFENTILDIQYELSEIVSGDQRLFAGRSKILHRESG